MVKMDAKGEISEKIYVPMLGSSGIFGFNFQVSNPQLRDTASIFENPAVGYLRMKGYFYLHGYAAYACLIVFVDNFTTG